jgi:hypothetical protein
MRRLFTCLVAALCMTAGETAEAQITNGWKNKISPEAGWQWKFDKKYRVGQFVNGEWWVKAPNGLTLTDITPATSMTPIVGGPYAGGEWWRDGTHIDPVASSMEQSLDSTIYTYRLGTVGASYDPAGNISKLIQDNGSYTTIDPDLHGGILSIITAKSYPTPANDPSQIERVHILTVVSAVPPLHSFRPPYTIHGPSATHQLSYLTTADVLYGRVNVKDAAGNLLDASVFGEIPSLAFYEGRVDGTWYEAPGGAGYMKRYSRPTDFMPAYGADVADHWSGAAFRTLLSVAGETLDDKKPLINRLVQIGRDRHSMGEQDRYDPSLGGFSYTGHWDSTAGQGSGAKMSILYYAWLTDFPYGTAAMLASEAVDGVAASSGQWFQLDNQCFVVDTSAAPLACGYGNCAGCVPNGTPEWGVAHFLDIEQGRNPTQDVYYWRAAPRAGCPAEVNPANCPGGPPGYAAYRISDTARAWWLQVLMSRVIADNLDLTSSKPSTWDSGYPFPKVVYDYMDRYYDTMTTEWCYDDFDTEVFSTEHNGGLHRIAWLTWGNSTTYFGRP